MEIVLNGNTYILAPDTRVRRTPLVDFPDNIRLDGQQQRKDRAYLSSWNIDRWSNGLGLQRMNVDIESHQFRLWDVENCDTRNPNQVILSPAFNDCIIVPSRGDLNVMFTFQNNIYFAQADEVATIPKAHQFSAPNTLGSFRDVSSQVEYGWQAIKEFGGYLVAIGTGNTYSRIATLGGAATYNSGLTPNTDARLMRPQIADLGGTLHILALADTLKYVNFWVGNQDLGSLTCVMTLPSAGVGSYLSPLVTDGLTMFANLPEAIYDFDITPAILIDNSRSVDLNANQTLFRQELLYKNKLSTILYDGAALYDAGYDLDDGLPADKMGETTAYASSYKYAFAAIKGATYAHILSYDSFAWQYFARVPTPGLFIRHLELSNLPDGIDRLWVLFDNHPTPGYYLNPIINPLQAATYSWVPTGYFSAPVHDGGMAEEPGAYYNIGITGGGMGGSNIMTFQYGVNGNEPVTTLGVVASSFEALVFGSPYGLEGHRIQPRFILGGADSGTTPQFKEANLHYLKIPDVREQFEFAIDFEQTGQIEAKPVEQLIDQLNADRNSKPLIPFSYGQMGTRNVKVLDMPNLEETVLNQEYSGERTGGVSVVVAEIV